MPYLVCSYRHHCKQSWLETRDNQVWRLMQECLQNSSTRHNWLETAPHRSTLRHYPGCLQQSHWIVQLQASMCKQGSCPFVKIKFKDFFKDFQGPYERYISEGARIEAPKASRGWVSWGVVSPSPADYGSGGASWAPPAGSGAESRPTMHSKYISGPQKPSTRSNALRSHGVLENLIQALSRTFRQRFKDFQEPCLFSRTFQALKIWKKSRTFKDPQKPCVKAKGHHHINFL